MRGELDDERDARRLALGRHCGELSCSAGTPGFVAYQRAQQGSEHDLAVANQFLLGLFVQLIVVHAAHRDLVLVSLQQLMYLGV